MKKILIASALGAIAVFVWGFLSWVILKLHDDTMKQLPNETAVVEALKESNAADGVYAIPGLPPGIDMMDTENPTIKAWTERHEEGPIAMLTYVGKGQPPMSPQQLGIGFGINFVAALLASLLLAGAQLKNYISRVVFVTGLGVFVAISADATNWNYMYFSQEWTLVMMADRAIGWFIAGSLMAAVMGHRSE